MQEWERAKPQPVEIDVELPIDAARAAAGDDLAQTVDYAALVASVRRRAEARVFHLLETLAEAVAQLVLKESRVAWVRVRARKRALPGLGYAEVALERRAARPARAAPRRAQGPRSGR